MKLAGRYRRHKRITKKLKGDAKKPRLVVFRSKKHIYAQLVDDTAGVTILSFSTLNKEFLTSVQTDTAKKKGKDEPAINKSSESEVSSDQTLKGKTALRSKEKAKKMGKLFAEKVLIRKIKEVCFDRAGYKYHGRIKALAEGIREGGIKF